MAEEIIEETIVGGGDKPSTFADDLYNASIQSGFIPKDATFDRFKENLKNEAFVKDAFNFSLESGLIPKDATYDRFTKNLSGTNPAEKKKEKPATELPVGGGSSGLRKIDYKGQQYEYNPKTGEAYKEGRPVDIATQAFIDKNILGILDKNSTVDRYGNPIDQKPFQQGLLDRQQGAISAAEAPDVQSEKIIKRNKKFPSFRDNPQIGAALDAYQNLKTAAANTADKQNEYELFLKTGTFTDENGQDIRPMGALPTDRLGNTAVVPDSPAANVKSTLEANLKKAKEDEDIAYNDLGDKENTFRKAKLPELPVKKGLGGDKYEYEMPSQVKVLTFMDGLSKVEDHAKSLGLTLSQYSDSIEKVASDAFLSPDQQSLYTELNSGDERAARSAIARYDDGINKQIDGINKMLASGVVPADQRGKWINERQRLTDQKSDFFSPKKAIEGAMTINPQLKPIFDAFAGIGDQDKASLVYAKLFKDSQDLAQNLTGEPLFIDKDGKQVLNPNVTNYLVAPPKSAAKQNILDDRKQLQDNINTMQLLAPATLLNRRPLEKKGSFVESFGKTLAKGIGYDSGFTDVMLETDKPSVVSNFLADATISSKDLPTNQAKQLEQIGKQSNWEFAGSTLGYLIPAGVQLAVGGAELRGLELIANALKRTSTAADLAYDVIKITKGSSMLSKAVKMGADAQLGGWTFNDPEMGFANIGAESLAGELFEKAIKKLPGGALVTKLAKKVFADNYITAMNKIGKANAFGLGETTGEFAGSLVQIYQDSDTWNDFYDKYQQQFGKASENLKFFVSCYSLGMVMGNHAAPATKAVDSAADKAYQKLTPDEKKIADEVIENDVDATNVATVDVLRNNVQVVPDADLKTRIEQVKKAKADLDALPDLKANTQNAGAPYVVPSKQGEVKNAKEGAYEIKVGDITLSGNTPEQLENDKDLINSLDIIYSGEQQRREAEGITVETPTNTEQVQQQPIAEESVGVEGAVVPEDVQKKIAELEDMLSGDALSMQETGQRTLVDRQAVVDELADLKKKYNIEQTPKAQAAPTFKNVPVFTYTPQDVEKAKNEVFDNLSKLQVGSVIENSDGEIKVVTDNSTDKKGNKLIGVVTFIRLEDGSLRQMTDPVFTSKSADGKIKLDYNPHTTGRNAKGEQVTVTDQITDKTIDLSKENIFIEDENGNLVQTNAFYTTTTQTQPSPINAAKKPETVQNAQENGQNVTEPTKAPAIKAQVVGTTAGLNTIIDGGLGKQKDPRTAFTSSERSPVFETQPNNNESSLLDISLPSTDAFGRQGGIQIRFELPNGVDANTVFEDVVVGAALTGKLDAKDPNFQQKVQGLVDRGIAKIQGLATGGAKQTAQVKETVSEKQVPPTTTSENPALKNVQSTATALSKIDKSVIDATLPLQPLEIDGYKREYRNDSPVSIAEAYHKAKADKSNPDLVQAVEELLAPKETAPTQKVDEGQAITESTPTAKTNLGEKESKAKEQAIPSETVDDLLQAGQKRRAAKEKLPTETMKETATVILKDNDIEAIFQKDTDESLEILMKLQEKLGIKKIC